MQFYKAEYGAAARPNVLINSVLPVASAQSPVAWVRGKAAPRPSVYSLTYHNKDSAGNPAVLYDSNVDAPAFSYSRELSDNEVRAYNPWNLLRATPNGTVDNWDPAGVRQQYESAGEGNLIYRMALTGSGATIRTDGAGATIAAAVTPGRVTDLSSHGRQIRSHFARVEQRDRSCRHRSEYNGEVTMGGHQRHHSERLLRHRIRLCRAAVHQPTGNHIDSQNRRSKNGTVYVRTLWTRHMKTSRSSHGPSAMTRHVRRRARSRSAEGINH